MALTLISATAGDGSVKFLVDTAQGGSVPVTKIAFGIDGTVQTVDSSHPVPVTDAAAESSLASITTATVATASLLAGTLEVGGTVTVSASALPTGAATAANQATQETTLASILTALGSSLPLPTGAASAANQATAETTLTAIAGSVAAGATQTTLASILSALQASLPLPTGGASAANQATEIASLASLVTNTAPAAAGQLPSASSRSVVTASDDSNVGPGIHVAGATVSGVNQDIIAAMDVSAYSYAVFTLDNVGTGCIISYQFSNDLSSPSNWYAFGMQRLDLQSANAAQTTQNSVGPCAGPLGFKWLRIRCTTYGSGSPTGSLQLSPRPVAMAPSYNNVMTPISVTNQGPANVSKLLAAASTNATSVKNSAAILAELSIANQNATTTYFVKLYNKASAPTVGTDTPVAVYPIAPKSSWSPNLGPFGKRFTTGLAMAITAGYADADTTAVTSAGDVVVSWTY